MSAGGPGLAELQRRLAAAIVDTTGTHDAAALLRVTPQGGAPRLDVYRGAFRARLTAALEENYPVLYGVLGDDAFAEIAAEYIAAKPSRKPSIRWFGHELAAYLASRPELLPHPALVDLARMEWALGCAFDAGDRNPVAADALVSIAPERWPSLSFAAHPAVRLLDMAWAVEPLWQALSVDRLAQTSPPEPLAHHLLVWRALGRTRWRSVDSSESSLLAACLAGRALAEIGEIASIRLDDDPGARLAGYLRGWLDAGLLVSGAGLSSELAASAPD
ncbi:MAG: putative DNA-binding domain-containing protein [Burkholderiaceae bacterium]|nr:putative DNA-binding domain-containing protein [Burkholderiaceae bacterium]